jgi:hypothetical protein
MNSPVRTPTGVTLIPPGATTEGVTTLIAGIEVPVVILGVAAAAAARAAMPVICPVCCKKQINIWIKIKQYNCTK